MDFISDALANGRKVRVLNIMDEYNREALTVHPHYSIPGLGVINQLKILEGQRKLPGSFRVNNGPEFTCFEIYGVVPLEKYKDQLHPTWTIDAKRLYRTI